MFGTTFAASKYLGSELILITPIILVILWLTRSKRLKNHKHKEEIQASRSELIAVAIIYAISAILLYLVFVTTTFVPTESSSSNVYEDMLWTIGNTWSLIRNGLPLTDARFSDVMLGYHIGQNLLYSFISSVTGISPIWLHLRIVPFFDLFFLFDRQ